MPQLFFTVRSLKYLTFKTVTVFCSYAPWCPACQNLQPEWESFAEWGEDLEVKVAKVDVTEQTGITGWLVLFPC
jgi:thiol-disulfide isomerase/thioredoxin